MPCTYYSESDYARMAANEAARLQKELDKATELLCRVCERLSKHSTDFDVIPGLSQWWTTHQAMDRKRIEAELVEAEKKVNEIKSKLKKL